MSTLSLMVVRLITGYAVQPGFSERLRERFSLGFWHLEPIVLGVNGVLLMSVAVYALINAIGIILAGGHPLRFGPAIIYAVVTLAVCLGMAWVGARVNRRVRSDFINLDVTAWIMSGGITAALLVAFAGGLAVEGTAWAGIAPYIDPAVLALVCLAILPLPVATVRKALSDVLLITPEDLKAHVDAVALTFVHDHGFSEHKAYVARVGRQTQIELYFLLPSGLAPRRMEEWDDIRDAIAAALGADTPHRWLTIVFTSDRKWV